MTHLVEFHDHVHGDPVVGEGARVLVRRVRGDPGGGEEVLPHRRGRHSGDGGTTEDLTVTFATKD